MTSLMAEVASTRSDANQLDTWDWPSLSEFSQYLCMYIPNSHIIHVSYKSSACILTAQVMSRRVRDTDKEQTKHALAYLIRLF